MRYLGRGLLLLSVVVAAELRVRSKRRRALREAAELRALALETRRRLGPLGEGHRPGHLVDHGDGRGAFMA